MLARLATVFLLASAAFVSAAPVDSRSTVSWKRQDDALASMLGNLTSVTGNTLSAINSGNLTDDMEAMYTNSLVDALNECANNVNSLPVDTGLDPASRKRSFDVGRGSDRSRNSGDRGRSVTEVIVVVLNSRNSFRNRSGRDQSRGRNNENQLDIALALLLASISRGGRQDIVQITTIIIIESGGRSSLDQFGRGLSQAVLGLY